MYVRTGIIAVGFMVGVVAWMAQSVLAQGAGDTVDPDSLLPTRSVVYLRWHGADEIGPAWNETVAKKALVDSGLIPFLTPLLESAVGEVMKQAGGAGFNFGDVGLEVDNGANPAELLRDLYAVGEDLLAHVARHGIIAGADLNFITTDATVVLPMAVGTDWAKRLDQLVHQYADEQQLEVELKTMDGREVSMLRRDGLTFAWWNEGSHLVLDLSQLGPNAALRRAAGKSDGFNKTPRYAEIKRKSSHVVALRAFVDTQALIKLVPQAIPQVPQMIALSGVDCLNGLALSVGFEGEAMRTEWDMLLDEDRKGPFQLLGKPLAIDQLPKLPADVDYVAATSFDGVQTFDVVMKTIEQAAELAPGQGLENIPAMIEAYEETLGYKIRDEVLASLGNEVVVYTSPTDGPLFLGMTAAIRVKDADTLEGALDRLADLIGLLDAKVLLEKKTSAGITYWVGGYSEPLFPCAPTVALSGDWLTITLVSPAAVRRFHETQSMSTGVWTVDSIKDLMPSHSGEVTGIFYSDPKPILHFISSFVPMGISWLRNANPSIDVDLTQMPRIEMITADLFPSVAVTTNDATGVHCVSRHSLPLTNAEFGLTSGLGIAGSQVALLLPAVTSARTAARRTQSMNNMKQMGLGLHTFHNVISRLPQGSLEGSEDLPVEDRLSWMAGMFPYLEADQQNLQGEMRPAEPWNSEHNAQWTDRTVPVFLNPSQSDTSNVTHYVGLAGVGEGAADLPADDPKAGVFGNGRRTRMADVRDGTSNTIAVMGIEPEFGPWGQAGPSTVRGLSEQPYIGRPGGFGGEVGGATALMLDGSVRFIAKEIDPRILEALVTKAGGEPVDIP